MIRQPRIAVALPPVSFLGFPGNEAPIFLGCLEEGSARLFEFQLDLLARFLAKERPAIESTLQQAYGDSYSPEHYWFHVGRVFCDTNDEYVLGLAMEPGFLRSAAAALLDYQPDIIIFVFQFLRSSLRSLAWVDSLAACLSDSGWTVPVGIVGTELGTLAAEDLAFIRHAAPHIDFVMRGAADGIALAASGVEDVVGSLLSSVRRASAHPATSGSLQAHPALAMADYPLPRWGQTRFREYLNARIGTIAATVSASRGCTFRCSFCDERLKLGPYRKRGAALLRQEVRHLRETHGVSLIRLADSLLNPSAEALRETAAALGDAGVLWCGMMRLDQTLDEESMRFLHRMGCRALWFGLESASPLTQKVLHKCAYPELGPATFSAARAAGIDVMLLMMTDLPFETANDIQTTYDYLESVLPLVSGVHFERFRLMQGTEMSLDPARFGLRALRKVPLETVLQFQAELERQTDHGLRELWLKRKGVNQIVLPRVGPYTVVTEI